MYIENQRWIIVDWKFYLLKMESPGNVNYGVLVTLIMAYNNIMDNNIRRANSNTTNHQGKIKKFWKKGEMKANVQN